ncbi:hypothetical protein [Luteolibacter sp. AS25]|uniref:hypothetical protein n=1 Tax=Luteolibacter sp. AS25 TaxID=3135776 RepID=UPI00398BB29F
MSLHAQLNEEALKRLQKQKRISSLCSLVISILTLVIIALALGFFILPSIGKQEVIVAYKASPVSRDEKVPDQNPTKIQRKPTAPSQSPVDVITTANASPISIPTVDVEVNVESNDFGAGVDFGGSWGSGMDEGFGGGQQTAFGRTGGGGLEGTFYDLKQSPNRKATEVNDYFQKNSNIMARLKYLMPTYKKLEQARFSESSMKDFYRSPKKLSFSYLVMAATTDAAVAPESFEVKNEVEPSAWAVVYEGRINPPNSGEFQFVGLFDDLLLVYVDDRLVLDGSFFPYSSLSQPAMQGPMMRKNKPLIEGEWVRLSAGTKIKIIVAESPGGQMGGGLFIREKGKKYRQAAGGDVLPPFTTIPLSGEDRKILRNIPIMGGQGSFPIEMDDVPVFAAE